MEARVLTLPTVAEPRGSLAVIQPGEQLPFEIARLSWMYGRGGGGCAFRKTHELLVALSGSFEVSVHDGSTRRSYLLNRANRALLVPPRHWRELGPFSTNAVALVVGSNLHEESDCIRDFGAFLSRGAR
jgi:hypothetical protein